MIWQRDHMVRRIYLTDKHSEVVKPSWFGESIGHYESDGTLVVDTIGLSAQMSYLDWYRTPHTEKEHVVERYKLTNDGNRLEVLVVVEDPDTFKEPLYMIQRWRLEAGIYNLLNSQQLYKISPNSKSATSLANPATLLDQVYYQPPISFQISARYTF